MKILQVIDRLNIGGAERVLVDLSNLLHEHNYNVSVMFLLYPGPMGPELHQTIPVFSLNRKWKFSLISFYRCAKHLKQFDIIHCHHQYVFNYLKLACLLLGVNSTIILHDHGPNREYTGKRFFLFTVFTPQFYIGVSASLVQWAKSFFRLNENNTFLIPNIIRRKHPVSTTKKYDFILVSNIKPEKNILFAVQLAKMMQISLLIVGNIQDESYYENIKDEATGAIVEFVTDCNDAQQYIAHARFGLHTSTSETGPLVLLEYLAYGLPFLAYDTGEVAAFCKEQYPDLFLSDLSDEKWASRIHEIQNRYMNRSEELYHYFTQHFGEKTYLNKCLTIYRHINRTCS